MYYGCGDDVLLVFFVETCHTLHGNVVGLGGATGKYNLLGIGVYESSQRIKFDKKN